jgi:hypothetical protein
MDGLNLRQVIGHKLIKAGQRVGGIRMPSLEESLLFKGLFSADLYRRGRIIKRFHGHNGITIVGKNHLLDVVFGNSTPVTQITPWYIGLVNDTPTPTFAEADTLASHAGWSEFTAYTGNRKAWDDANASNKIKSTTTVSTFTFSSGGTINGIFIASVASGTSGILWSTGSFDETVDVATSDELKVSYGIRT